jgi:transposase
LFGRILEGQHALVGLAWASCGQFREGPVELVRNSVEIRARGSRLPEIYGVGPIVAATIIGHVFDVRRYPTRHHFATANGTAHIPASSGHRSRLP